MKDNDVKLVFHSLVLNYDSYQAEYILRRLLNTNINIPKCLETVGHTAYLKISSEHIPYSQIIGQVFKDKTNKQAVVGILGTSFHFLAGKENTELFLKEKTVVFSITLIKIHQLLQCVMSLTD